VTLPAHLAALPAGDLPVVEGELRAPGEAGAFLLAGTLSTRIELKQANAAAQALLERWAEPWAVWASLAPAPPVPAPSLAADGLAPPGTVRALLDQAWADLLANHPHDSICGCGTDAVAREDRARSAAVTDLGEHLVERSLRRAGLSTRLPERPPADAVDVAVVNPHGAPLTGGVEVTLVLAPGRAPAAVTDAAGREVPFAAVPGGRRTGFDSDVGLLPHWPEHDAWALRLVARDVPPCGWTTYRVRLGDAPPAAAAVTATDAREAGIDGWHLAAADDGSVTLTAGGTVRRGLGRLEDGGDAGDTYTWEPPAADRVVAGRLAAARALRSAVDAELRLTVVLDLPAGLTADRSARSDDTVAVPVDVRVRRWHGVAQLEWTGTAAGTVADHRLRTVVPTGGTATTWTTDAAFSAVTRPVPDGPPVLPDGPGGEAAVGTAPLQTWCAAGGTAVLAAGLPEAEAVDGPDGTALAVTLLRGVGWLGRHDLTRRTMGAGPPVEVPDAQGREPHTWRWAVRWGDGVGGLGLGGGAVGRAPLLPARVQKAGAVNCCRRTLALQGARRSFAPARSWSAWTHMPLLLLRRPP
jgi:alpha-mannosidase/mannosylglycerate hydrolase